MKYIKIINGKASVKVQFVCLFVSFLFLFVLPQKQTNRNPSWFSDHFGLQNYEYAILKVSLILIIDNSLINLVTRK